MKHVVKRIYLPYLNFSGHYTLNKERDSVRFGQVWSRSVRFGKVPSGLQLRRTEVTLVLAQITLNCIVTTITIIISITIITQIN